MPFTPNSALTLVYPESLIPAQVVRDLPAPFHIRPLSTSDVSRGHLALLRVLTVSPQLEQAHYEEIVRDMMVRGSRGGYYPTVIISKETDQVVATGTVFVERKFIRNGGLVGHIEDIAVSSEIQGKRLGLRVIQALTGIAEGLGCYKTILDCSKDNIPFYEKCGFVQKEYEMAKYAPVPSAANSRPTPPSPRESHL